MNKLPDEILRNIFNYDDTYKHFFGKVIEEYMNLFQKYDTLFYKYHLINQNTRYKDKSILVWINKYGVNYNPIKWILPINT